MSVTRGAKFAEQVARVGELNVTVLASCRPWWARLDRSRWHSCTHLWANSKAPAIFEDLLFMPCRAGGARARCESPLRPGRWAADWVQKCP